MSRFSTQPSAQSSASATAQTSAPQRPGNNWWEPLGLSLPFDRDGLAARAVLQAHRPVGFLALDTSRPEQVSTDELASRISAVSSDHAAERAEALATRRAAAVAAAETALTQPGADQPVTTAARWRGFTTGEASAWCWTLFEYEPRGFTHPGSELRARALTELRAGGLPEVFGYPERARELADRGLTAQRYRELHDELGGRTVQGAGGLGSVM